MGITVTHPGDHPSGPSPKHLNPIGSPVLRQQHPLPHPEPSRNRVARAREACSTVLSDLARVQDKVSGQPGTDISLRPEWWLGQLQGAMGYLLVTMEDEDASHR